MTGQDATLRQSGSKALAIGLLALSLGALPSCTTHHWAEVAPSTLPPPPGHKVLHTSRLWIHVAESTDTNECVRYESYLPVCYYNVRSAIETGLERNLWPAYPEVALGRPERAGPSDYVLEVDMELDALPPDASGPGWSAGVRGRYRLLREGRTIFESTLATRSRGEFPYGAPLGTGASEAMDAALQHIARDVSQVAESKPDPVTPLPRVASRPVEVRAPAPKGGPTGPSKLPATSSQAPRAAKSSTDGR